MLKIKDNVDLKELEKFGFDDEMSTTIYYYHGECEWAVYSLEVHKDTRELELYVCTGDEDCSIPVSECMEKIFDLIKADMVEKVVEE
jgi:hypothetical protein